MRIGIYGGAFNPVHTGHVSAARSAVTALGLSKLLMIPTFVSPHKPLPDGSPTAQQRLAMLRRSVESIDKIEASDLEINRGGPSYTYETVSQIRQEYHDAELVLFMGTDMFLSFHTWRHPEKILKDAALGVFYRGQRDEKNAVEKQKAFLETNGATVYLVENDITEISSTDLRRMLTFGCGDAFLPPEAAAYIRNQGLYGTNIDLRGLSIEQLQHTVTGLLKPNRVAHVLGCMETAVELARHWGADPTDAARAGLLHDITKALDGPLQLTLCQAYGITLNEFSKENTKTLHALTGSLVAERIFGENKEVVSAIRSHTTGKANMNLLEKIIYVADYMEPNRDFSGVDRLRQLAFTDIDKALKLGLEMTLSLLREQGREISEESQQALAWLCHE